MRVLYLDHATEPGGAEVSLLGLLRTLDRDRFEPVLACPRGAMADRAMALGVEVIELHLEKLLRTRNPLGVLARLRRGRAALRRLLAERHFEVIHANTLRAAAYASGVARGAGGRFVWHVRDFAMSHLARRRLLRTCDVAIAASQFMAASLRRPDKVRVVPNGIDVAEVPGEAEVAAFREEVGLAPETPVVGCVGRLLRWKGQSFFLDVAARLAARLPEARFLVVGGALYADERDDYAARLAEQAGRLGLAGRLRFLGQRSDPLTAMSAMDAVVNCSQNEPFGRVLIEAMACRRPVVAFESGAVPEIVEDGSTGLLVPFGDVDGMADAVFYLLSDPTRAEAYGIAGRERVNSRFSLSASTRGVEAVYEELASRGGKGAP